MGNSKNKPKWEMGGNPIIILMCKKEQGGNQTESTSFSVFASKEMTIKGIPGYQKLKKNRN